MPREIAAYEISRKLVKAGISIAANYEEARGAFLSKEDFTYRINIAFKEARETNLWLRLIRDSKIINGYSIISPKLSASLFMSLFL